MKQTCGTFIYFFAMGLYASLGSSGDAFSYERQGVDVSLAPDTPIKIAENELLKSIRARTVALTAEVVDFWRLRGVDWVNGGFYGSHGLNGQPDPQADKGLIQQSRHLWTFSLLTSLNFAGRSEEYKKISEHTFNFLVRFYQEDKEFFLFQKDAKGLLFTNNAEQFYANAYAIYSLSQFGLSCPERKIEAKRLALAAFHTLVNRGFDPIYGGFDQTQDPWYFTDQQRQAGFIKDYNTHLHLLEAFTVLYQLTGDEEVKVKLTNLIDVFLNKMIGERNYIPMAFGKDWTIQNDRIVSYGHDIEAIWLIHEAMLTVGRGQDKAAIAKLTLVGEHAINQGFDLVHGGFYEEGIAGGTVTKTNKVWWAQAEALLGLWKLYQWTDDDKFLRRIAATLDWIETFQRKKDIGEWYWEVKADGTPDTSRYDFVGGLWKTSYHNGRALLLLDQWISEEMKFKNL